MLFKHKYHPLIAIGEITLTFRLCSKPQVKAGGRYRYGATGVLEVDAVGRVRVGEISDADAVRSGFADRRELVAFVRKSSPEPISDESEVVRVEFHHAGVHEDTTGALDEPSSEECEQIETRLARMDRLSKHGSWTMEILALIEEKPRVAASRLSREVGRETRPFKADVRKLKRLGLTLSHETGYEVSPRGRAYLAWARLRASDG